MRISDYTCKFFGTNNTLSALLSDIRKYDVPTIDEEEALITKYKNGDEEAGRRLICGHLRFIYSLAKIYARDENEVVDYVNEGVIGMSIAMEKYDLDKGYKFTTYAVWYIRRQMNFYLNDTRNMINRSNAAKIGKKVDIVKQKYYSENGREPSVDEIKRLIKECYGIDIKKDCDVYDISVASINEEIDDDYTEEDTYEYNQKTATINSYESEAEREYLNRYISEILSIVPPKQADIIRMSFGIGYERMYTSEEIGEKYKISKGEVDKLKEKILEYIRQNVYVLASRHI